MYLLYQENLQNKLHFNTQSSKFYTKHNAYVVN